jgi:hypothetical protein
MQGQIQEIQKEGAGTVLAKTLILACGTSMKYSGSMHAYYYKLSHGRKTSPK